MSANRFHLIKTFAVYLKSVIAVTLVLTPSAVMAIDPVEVAKLVASDGAPFDSFGFPISLDGDTVLIGASSDDVGDENSGSAYVFVRDGSTWVQQVKLVPNDGAKADFFGWSLSLDGDTAAVGAIGTDDVGYSSGSVYIFQRTGSSWNFQTKLLASDASANSSFGSSVSLDGDTLLIGSTTENSVAVKSGAAYVFERQGSAWIETAKLKAYDATADDRFGFRVALQDETAVVIANWDDDNGVNSGSAYVYVQSSGTWQLQAKLTSDDAAANDNFGYSVDLDGNILVVGVYIKANYSGAAYVFERTGTTWTQQAKIVPSDSAAEQYFGDDVSIDGNLLAVAADADSALGEYAGAAYVFEYLDSEWVEQSKILASDGTTEDFFGLGLSLDNQRLVIGATSDADNGVGSGSAYVFSLTSVQSLNCVGFEPPMANHPVTVKKNRALPLKAQVFNADGYALTDANFASPPVFQVWFENGVDDAEDVTDDALPAGEGTEGNQFVFTDDGKWQFNLKTKNYTAPGLYTIFLDSGDDTEYVIDPTCETSFVVK